MSRSTSMARGGPSSSGGSGTPEMVTHLIGPSGLGVRHSSAGTSSPASARVSGEISSVSSATVAPADQPLLVGDLRVGPDAVELLGLLGAEGGAERLVGVEDAPALLDDRDAVHEVGHHLVQLLGAPGVGGLGARPGWPRCRAPAGG